MDEKNWLELMGRESLVKAVLDVSAYAEQFGLRISREDAEILAAGRQNALKKERRVELGESVLPKLISAFCDSDYVNQDKFDIVQRWDKDLYLEALRELCWR